MLPEEFDKKYYKIKDISEILEIPQSTLRYWEREFPELTPERNATGRRLYTPDDIRTLEIIRFLLKERGMKIEAARQHLLHNRDNISKRLTIIANLEDIASQLRQLQKALRIRQ